MKGDYEYCMTCKRIFVDINEVYDTRRDVFFMDRCPFCLSFFTLNVSQQLERWKRITNKPKYVVCSKTKDLYMKLTNAIVEFEKQRVKK